MRSLSILLIIFSLSLAADIDKNFQKSFNVEPGATLVLESGDGDVFVRVWDKSEISIEVRYLLEDRYASKSAIRDFDVEFAQRGKDIFVKGNEYREKRWFQSGARYREYVYEIKAPAFINVDILGDDGNVEIENLSGNVNCRVDDGRIFIMNLNGDLKAETEDGDLRLEAVKGRVSVKSEDGSIHLDDITADEAEISSKDGRIKGRAIRASVYAATDDGDITLSEVSGERLMARSKDGDVEIDIDGAIADVDISTDDGRIVLDMRHPVDADFTIQSNDGYISTDLRDVQLTQDRKNYRRGVLGDGKGSIRLESRDGSIRFSVK